MKSMKIIKYVSVGIIAAIVAFWLIIRALMINIPAGQVGVLTVEYNVLGSKGVAKEDYKPGWHLDAGFYHSWILFDSTIQTLEMTKEADIGSKQGRDDVEVQTADGNIVSVDVTIQYRIKEGHAHLLFQKYGTKYKGNIKTQAQKYCRQEMGKLKTESFYNPRARISAAKNIKNLLAGFLDEYYIEIIDVLVRNVEFNPEYEQRILKKKLADQDVELNKSVAEAKKMQGKTQVIEATTKRMLKIIDQDKKAELVRLKAETNLKLASIKAEAKRVSAKLRADADLIMAKKNAEGKRLVKEAEAKGEKMRNNAMQGIGGKTIVALEAAKNLNLSDIIVSTIEIDFLDLDGMVDRLGLDEHKQK